MKKQHYSGELNNQFSKSFTNSKDYYDIMLEETGWGTINELKSNKAAGFWGNFRTKS